MYLPHRQVTHMGPLTTCCVSASHNGRAIDGAGLLQYCSSEILIFDREELVLHSRSRAGPRLGRLCRDRHAAEHSFIVTLGAQLQPLVNRHKRSQVSHVNK